MAAAVVQRFGHVTSMTSRLRADTYVPILPLIGASHRYVGAAPPRPSRQCRRPPTERRFLRSSPRVQQSLKISQDRLMNDLHHTSQWGTGLRWGDAEIETGMSRLSLSDSDKKARDWFASTMTSLKCSLTTDEMGNQFAIRPGKREGPATFAGSHLDTQPTGGRYDGVLGVTAAVEMMRTLHENGVQTEHPIGIVNWTNEEGARFPISMVSSGVWSGEIPLEKAHNLASVVPGEEGQTMLTELERIGYKGPVRCSHEASPIAAHFELHIEQGPTLENEERKVGIVEGVQAYRWYTITVQGKDSHTGTTALDTRSDALLAAAKMIIAAREVAHLKGGLATVGIIEAKPGSTNTIPGNVRFSLDVRAQSDELRDAICDELMERFDYICSDGAMYASEYLSNSAEVWKAHGDELTWSSRVDSTSAAVQFHEDCIDCVRQGAEGIFGKDAEAKTRYMVSGAGHDSVYTSKRCPTSMIFVPSRAGISHNPREFTTPEDCAIGAQVLMNAVVRYDKLRVGLES